METTPRIGSIHRALQLGFGGLLLLILVSLFTQMAVIRATRAADAQARSAYFGRMRSLDEIRDSLFLSGTFARDYLLTRDPQTAAPLRAEVDRKSRARQPCPGRLLGIARCPRPAPAGRSARRDCRVLEGAGPDARSRQPRASAGDRSLLHAITRQPARVNDRHSLPDSRGERERVPTARSSHPGE